MKYLDLFSGIGGFAYGIQKAFEQQEHCRMGNTTRQDICVQSRQETVNGSANDISLTNRDLPNAGYGLCTNGDCSCIGYSEIDKYASQVYSKHYPEHKTYGDITKIIATELPDFDLLVGGFPCQAFSIAGKRRGFDDTRGTLFFDIARILKEKRPRNFILENVKGLLSHDNGNTFKTIISTLAELGYCVEWQVLNSKNFGVPQNRERVFIIGHLGGMPIREVFPIRESNRTHLKEVTQGVSDAQRIYESSGISKILKGLGGGLGAKTGLYSIPVLTPDRLEKRQNGRRFKEDGEPSFTLTSQDKHGIFNGSRIRRLTPIECARLQGFPDNWCEGLSDTQQYKCYGNAVTTNVITELIKRLYDPKTTKDKED